MKGKGIFLLSTATILFVSCSHKINPERPSLSATDFKLDSLPNSEINVPIQVSLKPFYALAEKNIDTVFTSPNYPDDWIQDACDIRYKYTFRRGPLQMKALGTSVNLGFTGYYKIIGSTRVCLNGIAVSPWTPPCKCGFNEDERKVNVSFNTSFVFLPDFKLKLAVRRLEPQPLNKCEVCFLGIDITKQVMFGLKDQLDIAKNEIENTYSVINLKPYFQQAWNQLQKPYDIYGSGWLQINPQNIHINNLFAQNDSLNIYLGLSVKPIISFEKPKEQYTSVPAAGDFNSNPGFLIFTDAVLHYDSLNRILNRQLTGKELELDKGPVKKNFVIKQCDLSGVGNEKLIIKVDFSGSADGVAYFTGKPFYDQRTHIIEIRDLDFDVKTKDKFLRTARWLFNKKIVNTISEYAKFDLSSFIDSAKFKLNVLMNRDLGKGIHSSGIIDDINLAGIYPLSDFLVVRSSCKGFLFIKADSVGFGF